MSSKTSLYRTFVEMRYGEVLGRFTRHLRNKGSHCHSLYEKLMNFILAIRLESKIKCGHKNFAGTHVHGHVLVG